MPDSSHPRVLILSASFGEGHHSAAKNLAAALQGKAKVKIADPCLDADPGFSNKLSKGYQLVINHTPNLWAALYYSADLIDLNKPSKILTRKPEYATHRQIEEFQPDLIICTYFLYPYYIKRIFKKLPPVPVFTVVTDSIKINKSWTSAPTDCFIVTDPFTKEVVNRRSKISRENIIDLGFPVSPVFSRLQPLPVKAPIRPFKVLYFPTGQKSQLQRNIRAILNGNPSIQITLVLGKHLRKLYAKAKEIQSEFPQQIHLKGWTKKVPELMSSHHLVVGKAGGATSHECISASTPMLVHYLLPGQEQGNLQLLEKIQGGVLADTPSALSQQIEKLLENDGALWREMKQSLLDFRKPHAATECADLILKTIHENRSL